MQRFIKVRYNNDPAPLNIVDTVTQEFVGINGPVLAFLADKLNELSDEELDTVFPDWRSRVPAPKPAN